VAGRQAVMRKLADFLPSGITPVLIPDGSLHQLPGQLPDTETR
jgi:hypothetical protein